MKTVKNTIEKVRDYYKSRPLWLIPTVAIIFLLALSAIEIVRGTLYAREAEEYRSSVMVHAIKDDIESLIVSSERQTAASLCELSSAFDQDYEDDVTASLASLQQKMNSVPHPPEFWSLLDALPQPKEATHISKQLDKSYYDILVLLKNDERSIYCTELAGILKEIFFVDDLQSPQAVSALLVGQLENFQVRTRKATESLQLLSFPTVFEQEHVRLNELLIELGADLQNDENRYVSFARSIESTAGKIDEVLTNIAQEASDLAERPTKLKIAANGLENER